MGADCACEEEEAHRGDESENHDEETTGFEVVGEKGAEDDDEEAEEVG